MHERSDDVVPTISTRVAGPLGLMHLPRFWLKNVLHALNRLPPDYKSTTGTFDRMLIDALGIDESRLVAFIEQHMPTYLQFEAWVREHSQKLTEAAILEVNASYETALMSEGGAEIRRAELGIDAPIERHGILLNDLDDWLALHRQLIAPK